MLKILSSSPNYKIVNDIMWAVIIHCNKQKIALKKINWGNVFIKTKNCNIRFCLDKEVKKLMRRVDYDAVFKHTETDSLLRYISEVEKWLKCDLKDHV